MDPHDIPDADYDVASQALRDFYSRAHRVIDRVMTAQGASYARGRILMEIVRQGPLRSIDLAESFGFAPRTVTEAIDALERDGLVRRDPDPEDRRAKRISLTAQGLVAFEASEASRLHFVEKVFSVLSTEERKDLVRIIGKLNGRLAELGG